MVSAKADDTTNTRCAPQGKTQQTAGNAQNLLFILGGWQVDDALGTFLKTSAL